MQMKNSEEKSWWWCDWQFVRNFSFNLSIFHFDITLAGGFFDLPVQLLGININLIEDCRFAKPYINIFGVWERGVFLSPVWHLLIMSLMHGKLCTNVSLSWLNTYQSSFPISQREPPEPSLFCNGFGMDDRLNSQNFQRIWVKIVKLLHFRYN